MPSADEDSTWHAGRIGQRLEQDRAAVGRIRWQLAQDGAAVGGVGTSVPSAEEDSTRHARPPRGERGATKVYELLIA